MSDVPAVLVFLYCSRVYSLGLHNLTPEPRKKKKKKRSFTGLGKAIGLRQQRLWLLFNFKDVFPKEIWKYNATTRCFPLYVFLQSI